MKRLIYCLLLPLICGFSGGLQGTFDGRLSGSSKLAEKIASMPPGLTFYADYTDGMNGINADFSIGDGRGFYSGKNNDSKPNLNGGYHATTNNKDVLKYLIAGNRTAAQETIVIKFSPIGDFADDGAGGNDRQLTDTDTKSRRFQKYRTSLNFAFNPNASDSPGCSDTLTGFLSGVSYIVVGTLQHTSPYALAYKDGSPGTPETADDFINPAWVTYFYLGCYGSGEAQIDGIIKSVAFFNRVLSASEVLALNGLM
jgi:hypothetical protein